MSDSVLPTIVYEDDALIAFDKPSGLLVAPDRWDHGKRNLAALAHEHYGEECGNAHRLDRETSGVVVFAKTLPALRTLTEQFEAHTVEKRYLALVSPLPRVAAGQITHALSTDDRKPGTMKIDPRGKPASTQYQVTEQWPARVGRYALVELRPLTGRTHQLRVHLASLGAPIIGDATYGGKSGLLLSEIKRRSYREGKTAERPLLERLALHAEQITLTHPTTGERLTIRAELPPDMAQTLEALRRYG